MSPAEAALSDLSISAAGAAMRNGTLTSTRLTSAFLERIDALNPHLNAFIRITRERAFADAAKADADFAAGIDRGPLQGIPYALKDIFDTEGIETTCHSKLRLGYIPEKDSSVAARLSAGGGVLLGKLGTYEFAIGGPSHDLPFPLARNPWNLEHITGGSSSGAGAAVAAGMVPLALGTDTGGSIRIPAALCGAVGMKPSYGRVSRQGVFPLSYSLDHCGPLARSVEDAALCLGVIAGSDPEDPACAPHPVPDFLAWKGSGLYGLRIGYARAFFADNPYADSEIIAAIDATANRCTELGAEVVEIEVPDYAYFAACGRTLMYGEGYAIHETDLRNRPADYGRYTYQRLMSGGMLSASDYIQAQRVRRELSQAVNKGPLSQCDVLLTAAAVLPAERIKAFGLDAEPFRGMLTMAFNVTGNPALCLPIGLFSNGLPQSCQIVGRPFDEAMVFRVAAALEGAIRFSRNPPPLFDFVS